MSKEEIQLQAEKYSVSHGYRIKDKGLLKAVLAERKLSFSNGAEWMQNKMDAETATLKAENKLLIGLIERAHSEGYEDAYHHIEYSKSWQQFKTQNNLT